jgi:hypothetical protein
MASGLAAFGDAPQNSLLSQCHGFTTPVAAPLAYFHGATRFDAATRQ